MTTFVFNIYTLKFCQKLNKKICGWKDVVDMKYVDRTKTTKYSTCGALSKCGHGWKNVDKLLYFVPQNYTAKRGHGLMLTKPSP